MARPIRYCTIDGCERRRFGQGYCQLHYQRWRKHGDPLALDHRKLAQGRRQNELDDVWRFVHKGASNECWPWTGARGRRGYGQFTMAYRTLPAHRAAYRAATGIDPGELMVCHTCDNPPCCNPAHLFLGTALDNVRDMLAKERARPANGSRHHAAKLTEEQVSAIRARRAAGEKLVDLAREFGIGDARLSVIVNHPDRAWRHVA